MQAVILAGGLGTRMHPSTEATPKLLLPVAGRPFAEWLLSRLAESGCSEVVVCVGHLGEAVRRAIGDGARFRVRVRYSDDGPTLLGTAGALRAALDLLDERFLVTYGDSYLGFDYAAPLRFLDGRTELKGCMAVWKNRDALERSNVAVSGDRVARYDKTGAPASPPLDAIDYGATALRREVVAALPRGERLGLDEVQARLAGAGALGALLVEERFYEIGSPAGLRDLEAHLRSPRAPRETPPPSSRA